MIDSSGLESKKKSILRLTSVPLHKGLNSDAFSKPVKCMWNNGGCEELCLMSTRDSKCVSCVLKVLL